MALNKECLIIAMIIKILLTTDSYDDVETMVLIPAGEFNIGTPTKGIYLDSFYIDKTEVTQKDFEKIMGPTNFFFKGKNHPAEQISWHKAKTYCEKMGKRLPSEAEWKKAAKGGTKTSYFWGIEPDVSYGWYGGDYDLGILLETKNQTLLGYLTHQEMFGNGQQHRTKAYSKYSGKNIVKKVAREGAFNVSANLIASFSRLSPYAKNHLFNVGFRCAK